MCSQSVHVRESQTLSSEFCLFVEGGGAIHVQDIKIPQLSCFPFDVQRSTETCSHASMRLSLERRPSFMRRSFMDFLHGSPLGV
eukprot:395390-Amphidinium_carterae.1